MSKRVNLSGICLGMQLLGLSSAENGLTLGLGLIEDKVYALTSAMAYRLIY